MAADDDREEGWQADPDDPTQERWWDGENWTGATRPFNGGAPPSMDAADVEGPAEEVEEQAPSTPRVPGVLLVLLLVIGVGWLWNNSQENQRSREQAANETLDRLLDDGRRTSEPCKRVTYHVEGTARAVDITMTNASGGMEQASNRSVPLSTTDGRAGLRVGCVDPGEFVSISAQNQGETGTVVCRIEADGDEIARAASSGAYVIASCHALVP